MIKKILRVYGLDPNLFDSYTKQQKRFLFQLIVEPTRVKVEEGHRVPRRLVNFMAESTHHFLRTHYFGDESIGLTYLELSTYGLSFAYMLESAKSFFPFQSGQMETIVYVTETITPHRIHQDLDEVGKHIRKTSMMISKMNFRIYGYNWRVTSAQDEIGVVSTIFMSSENPISIHFKHKQKERIAFRVRAGRVITEPAYNAKIDRWFIFQEDETPSVYLDIYIQSHALQRIKERMDIFPAHKKNYYAMEPLLYMHYVQESPSGRPMLVCYFKDNERFVYLGYFPFIILKNKLIVLTFLPLVSDDTLSGQYLRNRLGLQMEDMVFLGMDKLSFYLTVDFDQIPVLKKALVNTEVWFLVEYAANNPEMNFTIDQKKTKMVKKFFEHKTDPEIDTLSSI
ncbi:MAG: hypothetical protein LBM08_06160 [Dysgonamonadaceae bacterium]|nr:hypothetical protein [Dysgonamonadaceae bacterium]